MIIFLNGPPRVGKDTVGNSVRTVVAQREHRDSLARCYKISARLKEMTHGLYGVKDEFGNIAPHDWFEDTKDVPNEQFHGLTPREAYIAVSEKYVKQVHGEDALGRWLAHDIRLDCREYAIVTDSGFRVEAMPIVNEFGANNCALVRLHRQGCSFEGDSRGYISLSDLGVLQFDVDNNGPVEETAQKILTQLQR